MSEAVVETETNEPVATEAEPAADSTADPIREAFALAADLRGEPEAEFSFDEVVTWTESELERDPFRAMAETIEARDIAATEEGKREGVGALSNARRVHLKMLETLEQLSSEELEKLEAIAADRDFSKEGVAKRLAQVREEFAQRRQAVIEDHRERIERLITRREEVLCGILRSRTTREQEPVAAAMDRVRAALDRNAVYDVLRGLDDRSARLQVSMLLERQNPLAAAGVEALALRFIGTPEDLRPVLTHAEGLRGRRGTQRVRQSERLLAAATELALIRKLRFKMALDRGISERHPKHADMLLHNANREG